MKASDKNRPLVGRCTDVGKIRSANEDSMGDLPIDQGHVLIVADGMGGYRGGALASHLVVEAIEEYFRDARVDSPAKAMRQAICLANERIYLRGQQEEELSRMGSTCVLALVRSGLAYLAHVGDSRIYLLRKSGKLQQLTRDHTVVQHFVDVGLLSPEEADGHPDSHILSRALGPRAHVEPELSEYPLRLKPGDRLLLCSDGLTKMLRDKDIEEFLLFEQHPQGLSEHFVQVANDRGGEDNVTVLIYEYYPTTQDELDALAKADDNPPDAVPSSYEEEDLANLPTAAIDRATKNQLMGEQHELDPLPEDAASEATRSSSALPETSVLSDESTDDSPPHELQAPTQSSKTSDEHTDTPSPTTAPLDTNSPASPSASSEKS